MRDKLRDAVSGQHARALDAQHVEIRALREENRRLREALEALIPFGLASAHAPEEVIMQARQALKED